MAGCVAVTPLARLRGIAGACGLWYPVGCGREDQRPIQDSLLWHPRHACINSNKNWWFPDLWVIWFVAYGVKLCELYASLAKRYNCICWISFFFILSVFLRVCNCHLLSEGHFPYTQGFKGQVQLSDGSILKIVHIHGMRRLLYVCMWVVSFDHLPEDSEGDPQLIALLGVCWKLEKQLTVHLLTWDT